MLISCGKCGKDVSDKARVCPHCKTPVRPLSIACPECGGELSERDLSGACPGCGYPLSHLRLGVEPLPPEPSAPVEPPPPPQEAPKPKTLECPNCGCVLPGALSASGKCPNCGFEMRAISRKAGPPPEIERKPERPSPPPRPVLAREERVEKEAPREAEHVSSRSAPAPETVSPKRSAPPSGKAEEKAKSRLRGSLETFAIVGVIVAMILIGCFLALRLDFMGVKSSLRGAINAEETEESLKGAFLDTRLWIKHAISVVLDQFPDPPPEPVEGSSDSASNGGLVERQKR